MGYLLRVCAVLALVAAACGDDGNGAIDAPTGQTDGPTDGGGGVDANPLMPQTIQETGLCSDPACETIAADAKLYTPRFELWSDGATKRRWIQLPANEKIDTTDMNHWVFPVGTKLWKEFTRGGTRVETRLLWKVLADDNAVGAWIMLTYGWNATQDAATLVESTGAVDANGTEHDIPSRQDCRNCHNGLRPTRVLGFGAMQLDFDAPADSVDLADLVEWGLLSAPPVQSGATGDPYFPITGATATDMAAFGYLHANCGHCHNPSNPNVVVNFMARLRTDAADRSSVSMVPTYKTSVNADGSPLMENGMTYTKIVVPKMPDQSILIQRMITTNAAKHMPLMFIGAELVDPAGQTQLRAWIEAMP